MGKGQGKGAIVCTASVAGIRNGAGSPAYSASKAGVISLVSLAANNLAGTGVRVNGVAPATVVQGSAMFPRDRVIGSLAKYAIVYHGRVYNRPYFPAPDIGRGNRNRRHILRTLIHTREGWRLCRWQPQRR